MTYQEIKTALKAFQAQGHAIPALNSKREVLEIALAELQLLTSAPEIAIEPTAPEIVEIAIAPTTIEDIQEITPAAEETAREAATTSVATPHRIRPEHPALTELRELARVSELTLIWSIATVRTILRIATPHIIPIATNFNLCLRRGLDDLLKTVIVAGVLWQVWIFPKIQLVGYRLALWAVLVVIKFHRKVAIA